jgi:hypothetical protein
VAAQLLDCNVSEDASAREQLESMHATLDTAMRETYVVEFGPTPSPAQCLLRLLSLLR